ncbi:MAG: hypothetical protein IH612_04900 [Desulfofustis sp.]|nr:hypothetical protein [Desulfofustis sp.]
MQHATQEDLNNSVPLTCSIAEQDLPRFATMLQAGFSIEAVAGESVSSILQRLPGFSADYIDRQIQTVFFNGDAIDDLSIPVTGRTASIALSAAMPGLAGAILRKNSPAAGLRKPHREQQATANGTPVKVRIKLFNTLAIERGPELCRNGVRIKAADLAAFLALRPALLNKLHDIHVNGVSVPADQLPLRLASETTVALHVL